MKGTVKSLLGLKNYGFIKSGSMEYFFHKQDFKGHWDDLVDDVSNKELGPVEVQFDVVDSPKGPRAANVSRLDFPNQTV